MAGKLAFKPIVSALHVQTTRPNDCAISTVRALGVAGILTAPRNTVHGMTDSIAPWIAAQSPDVRAELANLMDYRPEAEFTLLLSELLPVVPCPGLVDLYYDIWYCISSRLALRIAVTQVHNQDELAQYLALAERVLVDAASCEAFENHLSDADDVEEVVFWLMRRSGR